MSVNDDNASKETSKNLKTGWARARLLVVSVLGTVAILAVVLLFLLSVREILGDSTYAVEVLQALTSWPVAVFALTVTAFLLFRNPISSLIVGIRRIKLPWTEVETWQQQSWPSKLRDTFKGEVSDEEFDKRLREQFSQEEVTILDKLDRDQKAAIRNLLEKYDFALLFERIWGQIFRTQIGLLHFLLRNNGVASVDQAKQFWLDHRLQITQSNIIFKEFIEQIPQDEHFQQYFGWLQSMGLITFDETKVCSTELTNLFLNYITSQGYSVLTRQF